MDPADPFNRHFFLLQNDRPATNTCNTVLLITFGLSPLLITSRFTRASPNRLLSSEAITFPRFKRVIALLQLGISLFLIVASLVVRRQINYSLVKEPGQNHDQIVYLDYPHHLPGTLNGLRTALKMNNANVVDVIATSQLPHKINSKQLGSNFYFIKVDPEFKDFFDLKVTDGNWFKANDGDSIIVTNERAKQLMGADTANVIGTVSNIDEDFNLPEKPLKIIKSNAFEYNFLCIRLLEVDIRRTVETLSDYFGSFGKACDDSLFEHTFRAMVGLSESPQQTFGDHGDHIRLPGVLQYLWSLRKPGARKN